MKIVEEQEARERLDMSTCIQLMREALIALETGDATMPARSIDVLPGGTKFGFMPAYLGRAGRFGAKVVAAVPGNAAAGYPSHTGYVVMFDAAHGEVVGLADCSVITEVRTGAVSAVATDVLARPDAHVLALIGAGAQARSHLEAMFVVRPGIDDVRVFDINADAAQRFADEMKERLGITVRIARSAQEAVCDADIICTLTPSTDPYLERAWVKPGAHVNAVGTFSPQTREVCSDLMAAARLYADEVAALQRESGEYLIPLAEGVIDEGHVIGSVGGVLTGAVPGRTAADQITLFDALGLAVEDVACGNYLVSE